MTLNELKTAVSALLLEPIRESDPFFIGAANRAQSMIFTELPSHKTLTIPVHHPKATSFTKEIAHTGGETTRLQLHGAAYSFSVSGIGNYTVKDSRGTITKEFNTSLSIMRGFIDGGECEICFGGEYSYTVFSLMVFECRIGPREEDIPAAGGITEISADDYADDILALSERPRDRSGKPIIASRIVGRRIIFPENFSGLATVCYERLPKSILSDTTVVDVDGESASLLPILTAYFLLLEDDADRAEEYLMLFKSAVKEKRSRRLASGNEYTDVLGWT